MRDLTAIDYRAPDSDQQFVSSLRETGFGVLKNHPLDLQLIGSIYANWMTFFTGGDAERFAVDRRTQDGFFSMDNAESPKGHAERDIKEYFHFYPWGRCPVNLREELVLYYKAAHEFAATLLSWIERYSPVDIASGYREPLSNMIVGSDDSLLRILHYPPITADENVMRAAPHEDINLITILPMSSASGLEVLDVTGDWMPVPARFDNVIVNIGDMLQEASGGYFPSTTHRVVKPAGEDMNGSRMSLPLFLHPRPDVVLSERYTAASYLNERLNELAVV